MNADICTFPYLHFSYLAAFPDILKRVESLVASRMRDNTQMPNLVAALKDTHNVMFSTKDQQEELIAA
jgi:hypothetical protein